MAASSLVCDALPLALPDAESEGEEEGEVITAGDVDDVAEVADKASEADAEEEVASLEGDYRKKKRIVT